MSETFSSRKNVFIHEKFTLDIISSEKAICRVIETLKKLISVGVKGMLFAPSA